MMNHRGPEYAALQRETVAGVQQVFATKNDILFFPGSGTGGPEAAIVNCFSPGDRVLAVTTGAFGERWADIARAFGLVVDHLQCAWGSAVSPDAVAARLESGPPVKGVLITHNETSTGVTNPLAQVATAVHRAGTLLLVDAVSSMGAIPFDTDGWGVDVAITGSQKAWMLPPGMTMLSVSERAWAATAHARLPRSYWDFVAMRQAMQHGQTPYTPPISHLYALRAALRLMFAEGLEHVYRRHHAVAELTRRGLQRLGLALAADPAHYSDTVTAVVAPAGTNPGALLRRLREDYGVTLAAGVDQWAGTHFRIGHLGNVRPAHVRGALRALGAILPSG